MSDDLPQPPETLTGGCMCGAVRYTIAEKPLSAGLCHCNRCRPQSGSAFSTVIFVHRSAITIIGETASSTTSVRAGWGPAPLLPALRFAAHNRGRRDAAGTASRRRR